MIIEIPYNAITVLRGIPLRQAGSADIKTTPTLAAGDVKYSKDGGALANAGTIAAESPAASGLLDVTISAAESTCKVLAIRFIDAAGVEWEDNVIICHTTGHASAFYPYRDLATADVNVIQISGDSTAADNLELQYNTTGLAGDTFPATQAQVGNITSGTAAINTTAESFTKSGAEPETNTYAATHEEDGTYHIVEDIVATGVTDGYYQFDVGGNGVPVSVTWVGYAQGPTDNYTLWAYNYDAGPAAYEQIGSINAAAGTTPSSNTYDMTNSHVGTSGADLGKVRFRILSADGSAFATDRLLCSYAVVAQSVGYSLGSIWVDSAGTAGSEVYVNGTADNPCPWANALVISAALGITKFQVRNGNTVTLDANSDNYTIDGAAWTLALGGQSVSGVCVTGADVTGVASGAAQPEFNRCVLGAVTLPACRLNNCGIGDGDGLFTAGSAGQYVFKDCYSVVPGSGTPDFDFSGQGAAVGINNRAWTGGFACTLDSDCTLSHEVLAGGGTTITTGGGDVEVRGITRSLTVTMAAAETIQFNGVTGPIILNDDGATTATVNLYGVSGSLTDNTTTATVTDLTVSGTDVDLILEDTGTTIPGTITTLQATAAAIVTDTQDIQTQIGTAGAGLTDLGGMSVGMKAEVESEANDALVAQKLDHLVAVADADDVADDSIVAKMSASDGDWSGFDEATDSLEALRDLGDVSDGKIDTIAADVVNIDGAAMRGTDNAALASVCTEARLAELDAANLPADVGAILLDTGTDGVVLANNAITAAKIATDAITAAKIATDAIGADELAASAVAEIVAGIYAEGTDGVTLSSILTVGMAALFGVATVAGDTVVFKKRDGTTTAVTVVVGNVAGERDSSTIA